MLCILRIHPPYFNAFLFELRGTRMLSMLIKQYDLMILNEIL